MNVRIVPGKWLDDPPEVEFSRSVRWIVLSPRNSESVVWADHFTLNGLIACDLDRDGAYRQFDIMAMFPRWKKASIPEHHRNARPVQLRSPVPPPLPASLRRPEDVVTLIGDSATGLGLVLIGEQSVNSQAAWFSLSSTARAALVGDRLVALEIDLPKNLSNAVV